jgi:acetoin utilization deacetylase AcuC-like enzyme
MDYPDRRGFLLHATGALLTARSATGGALAQTPAAQVFYHPATLRHEPATGHPERPSRLDAAMSAARALERERHLSVVSPRLASDDDILLVHAPGYLKKVRAEVLAGNRTLSTGDTEISPGSLDAALAAAGAVLSGVDAVMSGNARRAFCAVRPPGHHASESRGMGFCVFNNIAIGARYARRRYGLDRILIADWDVHHGNGTQDVFWRDGSVMFFDTHQHPWYPGTGSSSEIGEEKGKGLIFNRPFAAGSGRNEILTAFRETLVQAAERFQPQLVMISAGFDSRAGDPLGRFTLTDADFGDLTDTVVEIARRHAGGRVVSVLEGGYSPEGLARAVASHLSRLIL